MNEQANELLFQSMEEHHKTAAAVAIRELLNGVPFSGGGHVSRNVLESLIKAAFLDGVLSERENPFTPEFKVIP